MPRPPACNRVGNFVKKDPTEPGCVVQIREYPRNRDCLMLIFATPVSFDSTIKRERPAAFVELVLPEELLGDLECIGAFHDWNFRNRRKKRNGSDDRMAQKISAAPSLGINDRAMTFSEWANPRGTSSGDSCGLFGAHELAFTHHLHHRHQPVADTRNNRRALPRCRFWPRAPDTPASCSPGGRITRTRRSYSVSVLYGGGFGVPGVYSAPLEYPASTLSRRREACRISLQTRGSCNRPQISPGK